MRTITLLILSACKDGDKYAETGSGSWDTGGAPLAEDDAEPPEEPEDSADTAEEDVCEDASDVAITWYLSADDSNSKAQPAYIRGRIGYGEHVFYNLRPYEFLNYYDFDYTRPESGAVSVVPQARLSSEDANSYQLLVGVVAPYVDPSERKAANFTFSLDTSGSMSGTPLDRVKDTMRAVAASLMDGDVVSIVRWDSEQRVVLDSYEVSGPDDSRFLGEIDDLESGGSTDLSGGLVKAYELAQKNYDEDRLNRVFLMSDGGANTGETDEELIGGFAENQEREGIYMMGVGAAEIGSYSEYLMDRVTDIGKGAYLFIDSAEEAERQFSGERFIENTQIAAYNVRLEMDLPAGYVIEKFHGEQMSTEASEVREQHLAPNDQMLYNMVIHDCDPDSRDGTETFTLRATWSDLTEDHVEEVSATLSEMMSGENHELTKAQAIIAYVDALGAGDRAAVVAAEGEIQDAITTLGSDEDLEEILRLLGEVESRL